MYSSHKKTFGVIAEFEHEVARYTGANFCIAVNSCTNAIMLCLEWQRFTSEASSELFGYNNLPNIEIPKHTYVSIPMQIKLAGFRVTFRDEDWHGIYQLKPYPIWDSARRFHAKMCVGLYDREDWVREYYICTSHHWTKTLGIQHGGCILTNDKNFDSWARRARHDGRTEGEPITSDNVPTIGFHCPMPPENAAAGLVRLASLPAWNDDLKNPDYPDLSTFEVFK